MPSTTWQLFATATGTNAQVLYPGNSRPATTFSIGMGEGLGSHSSGIVTIGIHFTRKKFTSPSVCASEKLTCRNRNYRIIFKANATGQLEEQCRAGDGATGRSCTIAASIGNVTLEVATVEWESTRLPMGRGPELPWV